MQEYVVGKVGDIPDGKGITIEAGRRTIAVFRIGSAAGSGYDIAGRLVGAYIGKHIPGNPTVVVQNVPGAGGLQLMNALYNVAPKDGTTVGMIGRGTAFDPILQTTPAQFEAVKFGWLGSMNDEVSVCVSCDPTS